MTYYSTNNKNYHVSFKEAVLSGLAPDGGLYMPSEITSFPQAMIRSMKDMSFQEIAFEIAQTFTDHVNAGDLQTIIEQTLTFDAPLVQLSEELSILELFHGPTLAFKDFGARFLANLITHYNKKEKKKSSYWWQPPVIPAVPLPTDFMAVKGSRSVCCTRREK